MQGPTWHRAGDQKRSQKDLLVAAGVREESMIARKAEQSGDEQGEERGQLPHDPEVPLGRLWWRRTNPAATRISCFSLSVLSLEVMLAEVEALEEGLLLG